MRKREPGQRETGLIVLELLKLIQAKRLTSQIHYKQGYNYEQARKLTTPKARNGHGALHSDEVSAESACMVDKEKRRNLNSTPLPL